MGLSAEAVGRVSLEDPLLAKHRGPPVTTLPQHSIEAAYNLPADNRRICTAMSVRSAGAT